MFSIWPKQPTGPNRYLLSGHQISVFISHSGRFGRIFCPFSMTEAQLPLGSTFLCACFRFRRPPAVLSVLSCLPAAPRLQCGCRRRCTGFPSTSSGPWLASGRSALSGNSEVLRHRMKRKQQNYVLLKCRFILRFLEIQLSTAYWRNSFFSASKIQNN